MWVSPPLGSGKMLIELSRMILGTSLLNPLVKENRLSMSILQTLRIERGLNQD
jgi:hypothetical protein